MKVNVIIATHKKYEMPKYKSYLPIHVGKEGKDDIGFKGDNTGKNISKKNPYFCELTGMYWAWKNLKVDYVGFSIPDEFVVGYGLDYAQKYRNLPYIGIVHGVEQKGVNN